MFNLKQRENINQSFIQKQKCITSLDIIFLTPSVIRKVVSIQERNQQYVYPVKIQLQIYLTIALAMIYKGTESDAKLNLTVNNSQRSPQRIEKINASVAAFLNVSSQISKQIPKTVANDLQFYSRISTSYTSPLIAQKIARMSAPVATGVIKMPQPQPREQFVAQKIARMSAPVTTGAIKMPRKILVAQKIARMSAPVTTGVRRINRIKPQTKALREILKLQKNTAKLPLQKMATDLAELKRLQQLQSQAKQVLQKAAEAYLASMLEGTNYSATVSIKSKNQ